MADKCLIVISLPKERAANVAIPKPPLKYPPYTLTRLTPSNWVKLPGFSSFLFFVFPRFFGYYQSPRIRLRPRSKTSGRIPRTAFKLHQTPVDLVGICPSFSIFPFICSLLIDTFFIWFSSFLLIIFFFTIWFSSFCKIISFCTIILFLIWFHLFIVYKFILLLIF